MEKWVSAASKQLNKCCARRFSSQIGDRYCVNSVKKSGSKSDELLWARRMSKMRSVWGASMHSGTIHPCTAQGPTTSATHPQRSKVTRPHQGSSGFIRVRQHRMSIPSHPLLAGVQSYHANSSNSLLKPVLISIWFNKRCVLMCTTRASITISCLCQ